MTEEALDQIIQGDTVDFGYLDESMQTTVIELVANDPSLRLDFAPEKLDRFLSDEEVAQNRRAIQDHFHPEAYGKRLLGIYQALADRQ